MAPVMVNSFILSRYQRAIIDILENIFTVNIQQSNGDKFFRDLLCDGDTKLQHKNLMTLQDTTLVLSIYTSILVNMKNEAEDAVSDTIIAVCDELVFAGLYNLQYNNIKFEITIKDIIIECNNMSHATVNLDFNDVLHGIYGVRKNINLDPTIIIDCVAKKDCCDEIFTKYRYLNMLNIKSNALFFTKEQHFQIIIDYIRNSKFVVQKTNEMNMSANLDDITFNIDVESLEPIIYVNNCNIPINYNLDSNVEFYNDNLLYTVIIQNELKKKYFYNLVLTEDYNEAATEALEYEYGIVVAFSRTFIDLTQEHEVVKEDFINKNYTASRYISHLLYSNENGNLQYYIVDSDLERFYLKTTNIERVFARNGLEGTKYNQM